MISWVLLAIVVLVIFYIYLLRREIKHTKKLLKNYDVEKDKSRKQETGKPRIIGREFEESLAGNPRPKQQWILPSTSSGVGTKIGSGKRKTGKGTRGIFRKLRHRRR